MNFISKFIIILIAFTRIFSSDNIAYTIFQENSNYPKTLNNNNGQIVTFSSFNQETYLSIFNDDTTPIKEHIKLNFQYNSNAAIIEYKNNNYLIATRINSYIDLIYFDEMNINNSIRKISTDYTLSSYKINLLLLNDNSFLLNFISGTNTREVHIKQFNFSQTDESITYSGKQYTTSTDNFFISCIKLKENDVLCEYLNNNCQNYYIILKDNNFNDVLGPHNMNIINKENNGCAFDKVINVNDDLDLGASCFLETNDFECVFWSYNSTEHKINLYNINENVNEHKLNILNNCVSFVEQVDITLVSNKKLIATCLNYNDDYKERYVKIRIIEITNELSSSFTFTSKDFSLPTKHADYPSASKFNNNLYAIFYNINGSLASDVSSPRRKEGSNIFELFDTIICEDDEYFIALEESIVLSFNYFYSLPDNENEIDETVNITFINLNNGDNGNNIGEIKKNNEELLINVSYTIEQNSFKFKGKNTGISYLQFKITSNTYSNTKVCKITFNVCYEGCKKCNGIKENSCTECDNDKEYYYKEEEKNNESFKCYNGDLEEYILKDNSYQKCYENCKYCFDTSNNNSNQKCIECKNNYYSIKYNNNNNINCYEECPNDYATNESEYKCVNCKNLNLYHIKGENECLEESQIPNSYYIPSELDDFNNLEECYPGTGTKTNNKNVCVEMCNNLWYKNVENNIECVDECPNDYSIIEISENQCVKSCLNKISSYCGLCLIKNLFLYENQCIKDCPKGYFSNLKTHECEYIPYCELNKQNSDLEITDKNIFEVLKNFVNEYVIYISSLKDLRTYVQLIIGSNYIISIYRNDTCQKNYAMENNYSYTDLNDCKNKISSKNYINIYDIIIAQIEYNLTQNYSNFIFYETFYLNENNYIEELDLSICSSNYINIYHPISQYNIDLNKLNYVYKKGYNPFDMKNILYNDFCESFYDERNRDVLLIDRQIDFFFNYTLCQDGCLFEYFDNQSLIKCRCNLKKTSLVQNQANNIIKESFLTYKNKNYDSFQKNNNGNNKFLECINNIFNLPSLENNIFQIFFLFLTIVIIICYVLFISNKFKLITSFLSKFLKRNIKSNPPKEGDDESSARNDLKTSKKDSFTNDEKKNKLKNSFQSFNLEDLNEIYTIPTDYKPSSINNNHFNDDDSHINDKKNIKDVFEKLFKNKIIYVSIICYRDIFQPFIIQLIALILHIILIIILNTMFYSKERIRKKYNEKGNLSLKFYIKNDLIYSFYVSIISTVLFYLLRLLYSGKRLFLKLLKKEKSNIYTFFKDSKKILKYYKIQVYFFLSLVIVIFIFSFYYVSTFCSVFVKTQLNLFELTLCSMIFSFLLQLLYICIIILLREISLKFEVKSLYYFIKVLIDL